MINVRTLEEGAVMERDKLEAEKKELEGRANFLLFTQEQLRSQASAFTSSQNLL